MKPRFLIGLACLGAAALSVHAQPPNPAAAASEGARTKISERVAPGDLGSQHTTYQQVTVWRDARGREREERKVAYVELAAGLNYLDNGQWKPSQEVFESFPGGAVARHGPVKAIIANNLNTKGAIDLELPDGQRLVMSVVGLGYWDDALGKSVLIAEVQDSVGRISATAPNEVWFDDAFRSASGFRASVRYRYTKSGLEQDVILQERPPTPEDIPVAAGQARLSSRTSKLQVITEVISGPSPTKLPKTVASANGTTRASQDIDFGSLRMVQGQAFRLGDEGQQSSEPVTKEYLPLSGRAVIVEEIAIPAIAHELDRLPVPPPRAESGGRQGASTTPAIRTADSRVSLPAPRLARNDAAPMMTAQVKAPERGFLVDYTAITTAGYTNYVFRSDTTYYLSGTANLYSNTVLEGGTVIKATNTSAATLSLNGPLICQTSPFRPVVFTSKDDATAGGWVPGSSGSPSKLDAVTFITAGSQDVAYKNLRFVYGGKAVSGSSFTNGFWNCQFVNCGTNVSVTGTNGQVRLYNLLASKCETVVAGTCTLSGEQVTADLCNRFAATAVTSGVLTNCVLTGVTNLGNVTLYTSAQYASKTGVYQTVGAGDYYLVAGSTNRNVGSTSINTALLADLRQKTTYAPVILTNTMTADTTLEPTAQRDTDLPDLGYHYDPIDYWSFCMVTNATMTLRHGVVMGYYRNMGVWLQGGAQMASVGTPVQRNWFAYTGLVQEQPVCLDPYGISQVLPINPAHSGTNHPTLSLSFTSFAVPLGANYTLLISSAGWQSDNLSLRDCEFFGTGSMLAFEPSSSALNYLENNLFSDCYVSVVGPGYSSVRNNLFHGYTGSSSAIAEFELTGSGQVKDNAFDRLIVFIYGTNGYNAWLNGAETNSYSTPQSGDIVTNMIFLSGPLGDYYLPPTAALINAGSRNATNAGLYHYTTQINQVKESNSVVDIGYHYVAVGPDPAGLGGYWRLDDGTGTTATDSSDGGNNGTLQNGPVWTSGQIGSGSLNFDGTNDYVDIPSSAGLKPTNAFSVSGWIRYDSIWNSAASSIVTKGQDAEAVVDWGLAIMNSGKLRPLIMHGGSWGYFDCATPMSAGTWHHVAMTYDGSYLRGYVNGALDGSAACSGAVQASEYALRIGAYAPINGTASKCFFDGSIDDVRLYTRALTANEIAGLASIGPGARDTDGDGYPDYYEDTNGNGTTEGAETDWLTYNSGNGLAGGSGLTVFTPLK